MPNGLFRALGAVMVCSAVLSAGDTALSRGCMPAVPGGAIVEGEPSCGQPVDTLNGGCNSPTTAVQAVPANCTIVGTLLDSLPSTFDTDTFEFTLPEPGGNVTVTAWADYPVYAALDDTLCSTPLLSVGLSAGCEPAQASVISLPAGRHRLLVTTFPGTVACGSPYVASIKTCPCPGDFNGDCVVNSADLVMMLGRFGRTDLAPYSVGDLNNDRAVSTPDLVIFIARFGCAG